MSNKNFTNKTDEIDLMQFFRSFGDFVVRLFKGFLNIILQLFIFSIRKWFFLFIAAVLAVGFSFLLTKIQKNLYYSDLVMKSNAVDNQEMISYIDRLENLTNDDNYEVLANALNISEDDARTINEIYAFWFIDKNKDELVDGSDLNNKFLADTNVIKVEWKFGIRASVNDPAAFNKISEGINFYVNSNDYFVSMNKNRLKNLKEIIEQINFEVEKLDSLQRKEYFRLRDETRLKEGQLIFTNDPVIQLFHKDLLALVKNKMESQTEFEIHNGIVSILEDFTITQKPENGISFYAEILIPIFLGLSYFLALFIRFKEKVREVFRKQRPE